MVDFKKLREAKAKPKPVHPRDIFNALPKPPAVLVTVCSIDKDCLLGPA
jgi:hypothetical protein